MFKSILPSKRLPSADFTMVTSLGDAAKENQPENGALSPVNADLRPVKPLMKKKKSFAVTQDKRKPLLRSDKDQPMEAVVMNQAFDKLLDELQIPSTLRPKLSTMDSTVKAAMLKSSQTLTSNTPPSPPLTPRSALRRTRSSESLDSPRLAKSALDYDFPLPPPIFASRPSSPQHTSSFGAHPRVPSGLARVASFDLTRVLSKNTHPPVLPADSAHGKSTKDKGFVAARNISPAKFFGILSGTSSTQLDVENVKKLRLLLRNESASWSQEFLKLGGYAALLTRLNEILEVEWREEQHDDQILHELLRCFKALSTSAIGCFALRSSCPRPFVQLVALLYSDKKPGEVATRQLIVDLLLILFELYPPSSLPSSESNGRKSAHSRSRPRHEVWESESSSSGLISLPSPHKNFYSLIQALLLTPAPPPSESPAAPVSPHAFIESLHRPRIYKNYLQELSDVCRDYFWVFCHPNNTIWVLKQTDERRVEKPRAPGGMTGGVEFEAIGYFTTHLKLVNAIAKAAADLNLPKEHDHSAYRFHSDLFLSGIERIILISRKASITYYPTLHLELARYVSLAGAAGFELPWTVSRLVGMPPQALCKDVPVRATGSPGTSPKKRGDAPMLPSPQKVEPIKFD